MLSLATLFDASVLDKVSKLSQDFLLTATSMESAQRGEWVWRDSVQKIAKGVMNKIVRF